MINNTGAYQQIADAHLNAIQDIADEAKAVVKDIRATIPPLQETVVDDIGTMDITMDSPLGEEVPSVNGAVNDANTNLNASSSTPTSKSKDHPGNATRIWYTDKTIIQTCDESEPHWTHKHHYVTTQRKTRHPLIDANLDIPTTAVDTAPAFATVRFADEDSTITVCFVNVASTAIQLGPTGLPQPFNNQT